jgi:hypothetical protein
MTCALILWLFCGAVPFLSSARAQSDNSAGITEMARLAKVLAGDWNTVEIVQHGKPVPEGAGRRGTVHVTSVGGGTALVSVSAETPKPSRRGDCSPELRMRLFLCALRVLCGANLVRILSA